MSERTWEVTLKHAKTCEMGNKNYIFHGHHFTVYLNPICQVLRAEINGQIYPIREMSNMNRVNLWTLYSKLILYELNLERDGFYLIRFDKYFLCVFVGLH